MSKENHKNLNDRYPNKEEGWDRSESKSNKINEIPNLPPGNQKSFQNETKFRSVGKLTSIKVKRR